MLVTELSPGLPHEICQVFGMTACRHEARVLLAERLPTSWAIFHHWMSSLRDNFHGRQCVKDRLSRVIDLEESGLQLVADYLMVTLRHVTYFFIDMDASLGEAA